MSINPIDFYNILKNNEIDFFTGVPDSLLKYFCLYVDEKETQNSHIIAANEGNAIALAAGYHLGTGKIPLVYMQNSGLGNTINPLLSLCDSDVYSIPMLILVGWRGEPGVKDEPQHVKQGKIQSALINSLDIPYSIISKEEENIEFQISNSIALSKKNQQPYILIIKKDTFSIYTNNFTLNNNHILSREESLNVILETLPKNAIIVSTTGKTSREIFELRVLSNESHERDFLTVGSMGHCSSIALGIAISNPSKKIVCIDGDGSMLMHLGSLSTIGKQSPKNLLHILINNEVHESVGGQQTAASHIDIQDLVKANSYNNIYSVANKEELKCRINELINNNGPNFLEVKVKPGSRKDLGRPTISPRDNKYSFMEFINTGK